MEGGRVYERAGTSIPGWGGDAMPGDRWPADYAGGLPEDPRRKRPRPERLVEASGGGQPPSAPRSFHNSGVETTQQRQLFLLQRRVGDIPAPHDHKDREEGKKEPPGPSAEQQGSHRGFMDKLCLAAALLQDAAPAPLTQSTTPRDPRRRRQPRGMPSQADDWQLLPPPAPPLSGPAAAQRYAEAMLPSRQATSPPSGGVPYAQLPGRPTKTATRRPSSQTAPAGPKRRRQRAAGSKGGAIKNLRRGASPPQASDPGAASDHAGPRNVPKAKAVVKHGDIPKPARRDRDLTPGPQSWVQPASSTVDVGGADAGDFTAFVRDTIARLAPGEHWPRAELGALIAREMQRNTSD